MDERDIDGADIKVKFTWPPYMEQQQINKSKDGLHQTQLHPHHLMQSLESMPVPQIRVLKTEAVQEPADTLIQAEAYDSNSDDDSESRSIQAAHGHSAEEYISSDQYSLRCDPSNPHVKEEKATKGPKRKRIRREFPLSKKQKEYLYKKFSRLGSCRNVSLCHSLASVCMCT